MQYARESQNEPSGVGTFEGREICLLLGNVLHITHVFGTTDTELNRPMSLDNMDG
jgi:hypothetical protein